MHGVGRHTQVRQIARGCIVQALPHKHRRLVDDSYGEVTYFRGQPRPHPKGAGPQRPIFLGPLRTPKRYDLQTHEM